MVLVTLTKQHEQPQSVTVFGRPVPVEQIDATPNRSWGIDGDLARYFTGVSLGDKMIASSGMTIGNNDLFLRRIVDGQIVEPYEFRFAERPITVEGEIARARLGKVSPKRLRQAQVLEARGATETVVAWDSIAPGSCDCRTRITAITTRPARRLFTPNPNGSSSGETKASTSTPSRKRATGTYGASAGSRISAGKG